MYSRTVESSVNSKPERVECMAVSPLNAFVYFFKSYSLDGAYRIREIFVYNGFADPTASNICADWYDWRVDMPIFDAIFTIPWRIALL